MAPIAGRAILTAAEMRAAEVSAVAGGDTYPLMERAGQGIAATVRRLHAGAPVLILCGPGNNGGDGYVAARALATMGVAVRVAASGAPTTESAQRARGGWTGPIEDSCAAKPAAVLVDALFGTGLARPLDADLANALAHHVGAGRYAIAIDLPSGIAGDSGELLSPVPRFDLTLALGALKPAHLLARSAELCGTVRLVEIGIPTPSRLAVLDRPSLTAPGIADHKYTRGFVGVVAGPMRGAALLAAEATQRAGAGYVTLLSDEPGGGPNALVHRPLGAGLADQRLDVVVIGPGLGRNHAATAALDDALASNHRLVIDGDALHLLDPTRRNRLKRRGTAILTPHAGEFAVLTGHADTSIGAVRAAAAAIGAVIVLKGAATIVADPTGDAVIAPLATPWLSTAGTGDVLTGAIAANFARADAFTAAKAGVWLHAEAARRAGAAFIADDLVKALTPARASLA